MSILLCVVRAILIADALRASLDAPRRHQPKTRLGPRMASSAFRRAAVSAMARGGAACVLAVLAVGPWRALIFRVGGARRRVSGVRPWVCGIHITEAAGCIVRRRPKTLRSKPNQLDRFRRIAGVAVRSSVRINWVRKWTCSEGAV
jgi:hypothetical protein